MTSTPEDAPGGTTAAGSRSLLGSSAVMAAGTVVSRITGFVRSLFMVWAIGLGLFADTFNLANSIPTSLYILVAGGALNAVFVPQLVRAMKHEPDGGEAFGQRLFTATAVLLAGFSVLAVIFAPLVIRIYASPSIMSPANHAYYDLAVTFARYCLPQIFFYGLYVILGQILNARGNFGPMMWSPILNNLVGIAVFGAYILVAGGMTPGEITGGEQFLLGAGTTLGIAVQALALLPVLRRTGFRLRFRFDLRGSGLGKSGRLALWTMGFVVVNQVWFVVVSRLTTGVSASPGGSGRGLASYQAAYLIFQLPHSVIAVSLVAALLPQMSRSAADGALGDVATDLAHGLRMIAVSILPAVAAFLAFGPLLGIAMYAHGSSTSSADAAFIGYILMGFAPAMLGFSSQYANLRGFYAFEDTRTPMFVQLAVVGSSIAAASLAYVALPVQWKTVGIAVAYGVGYWIGFAVGQRILRRRLGTLHGREVLRTYARATAAALLAGALGYLAAHLVVGLVGSGSFAALLACVVGGVVLLVAYVAFGKAFRLAELDELLALVRRRTGRGSSSPAS